MIDMSGSGALFGTSGLSPCISTAMATCIGSLPLNGCSLFNTSTIRIAKLYTYLLVVRQVVGGQQLGSHVLRRANSTAQCHRFLFHFRQSKVSNFGSEMFVDENVCWFQISVNDSSSVQVRHTTRNVDVNSAHFVHAKLASLSVQQVIQ